MPTALPVAVRQAIVERHQQGQPLAAIAQALAVPFWTVRQVWRRFRKQGAAGLPPGYVRCAPPGPRWDRATQRIALFLRRRHRTWGAPLIRVLWQRQRPGRVLPAARTLQRWYVRAGLGPSRAAKPPQNRARSQAVHEVWQMDATERHRLADTATASWLTLADERSGALLETPVFSPRALADRARHGGAGGLANGLRPVGLAPAAAGGQRLSLGLAA
jgi:hypothetical protein